MKKTTKKVDKKTSKKSTKQTTKKTTKRSSKKFERKTTKKVSEQQKGPSAAERIDEWIAQLGDWRGERLAEIRKLIHEVDPGVVEEWKWMGTPVWSHEGMYVLANPHKGKVKVTFVHGARLPDPKRLFNAGLEGNKWRAIDLFEGDKLDKTGLETLLRAAILYNTTHKVPKSKGSRGSARS